MTPTVHIYRLYEKKLKKKWQACKAEHEREPDHSLKCAKIPSNISMGTACPTEMDKLCYVL